ncbi:MAG: hypothetical protein PUJ44_06265 [Bacteroidales bacterium]|nr:hypothetical protein [Bacteroidales bacterium]
MNKSEQQINKSERQINKSEPTDKQIRTTDKQIRVTDKQIRVTDEQVKEREKALKETETFRENVLRNFCGIANFAKIREKCSGTCTHRLQAKSAYWLTGVFSLILAVDVDRFLLEMVFLFFTTRQKEDDRKKRSNTEAGERSGIPWLLIRL